MEWREHRQSASWRAKPQHGQRKRPVAKDSGDIREILWAEPGADQVNGIVADAVSTADGDATGFRQVTRFGVAAVIGVPVLLDDAA